jgi:drug/metabolite transporter (DMT)-like permease
MPTSALILLFVSAVLHTTWNLLLKQANDKFISTWWAVLAGSVVFLPVLFLTGLPARQTWILLAVSVCVEVIYYALLSYAYQDSDFSLVYPMARGAAPVLIALWSIFFLGEMLTPGGVAGLITVILGLIIVGSSGLQLSHEKPHPKGIFLALAIALLISIYSVIDGAAVKQTSAFPYAILVFFLAPVITSPLLNRRYGWERITSTWKINRKRLFAIGLLTVIAYLLTLTAYSIAPISYSGAIREVSVVFGAFAGWRFLGEKMGWQRMTGSVIIFIGILMIAIIG